MQRFAGKVAIVTGGAGGIGAACAARLSGEGARVMVADLRQPEVSAENQAFVQTDISDSAAVAAMVAATMQRWGRIDILVNNAGVGLLGNSVDTAEEDWDRVFAINTRAIYLACKAAIPEMRESGGGAIVNVASISGMAGDYAMAAYNASKGAVINYTRSLALDCAEHAIRVNALCPGLVDTPMSGPPLADPIDSAYWFERIPLGRAARPEEMAAAICFLASDDASYMTGSIVAADGGITAHTGQPHFPKRIAARKARTGA
jgi:meso-butanediol dehydrogenase/(S,S)-butanediol dehydrogenase/diacetyl reductase